MREQTLGQLTGPDRERVTALVAAAASADGHVPLSEEARLSVAHGRAGTVHLIEHGAAGAVLGYAYIGNADPADPDAGRSCELVIAPEARGAGLGTLLARDALKAGATRFWAHGAHPGARRVAAKLGLVESRELRLMEVTGWTPTALSPKPPAGISIRAFRPGEDDEAWVKLNGEAFASHPEQGQWTLADLAEREAESWFDPAGFFLAERGADADRELVGFHWTKTHPAGSYAEEEVGEVYVLGVSPSAQGTGLGRVLLHQGLDYLTKRGFRTVILYVDGDNTGAVRLYERAGFHTRSVDLEYRVRG
ncbi:mycothiol synthase [Actinospica sp.]|uniref:mycothiol synthase n=1 Tax=Actinospica sp. TaxID=1872142 RepID=UPI002C804B00|nr:mycothiol synthase [Actinospica sp.]HWG22667.1 mycothiol synthase [Actinospica sp.]